jgi:hypothetical protein
MADYKKKDSVVEYKQDLIRGRRCKRGGRLTWGRGSHRRKTPQAEKDKDRVRIGSECQTVADLVTERVIYGVWPDWMGLICGATVLFELVS